MNLRLDRDTKGEQVLDRCFHVSSFQKEQEEDVQKVLTPSIYPPKTQPDTQISNLLLPAYLVPNCHQRSFSASPR